MGINRRNFIQKASWISSGILAASTPGFNDPRKIFPAFNFDPEPSAAQKAWMKMGFGMFIHFGVNTFYDKEWSDGNLDPYRFNPVGFDSDQWCRVARDAGMKYIVLVTKHHDGFCLWPSSHSNYTISRSQFNRDIVAALVSSARKYDLKVGFYFSLWDQHMDHHIKDEWIFIDFIKDQLTELLTGYGEVTLIWFDGFWKRQQSGWEKKPEDNDGEEIQSENDSERDIRFVHSWRMEGAYRWQMDHLYNYIKSLQENCLVMNNSTGSYPGVPLLPVDIRSGERYTVVKEDKKLWDWLGKKTYLPLQIETTMSTKGNQRFPSGNWFWHEWDHSVLSKEDILSYLEVARSIQANLLLNVGPDTRGKLREEDIRVLSELEI